MKSVGSRRKMARKREKILDGYNEKNLIKIEGKGKPSTEIYITYLEYIQSKGFCVTTDEIATYLRASYQYVTENILPEVLHIRINDSARSIILKTLRAEGKDNDKLFSLVMKRVLFEKESFQQYILSNARYERIYKRIYPSDFDEEVFTTLKMQLKKFNEGRKRPISLERLLQMVMDSYVPKHFIIEPVYQPLTSFPSELVSQRDLMGEDRFTYKVTFYRYIEQTGINKVKIDNLVRYLPSELEDEEYLCWIYYSIYQNLPKGKLEFSLKIKEKAMNLLSLIK
jgi:hypothetical protein